MIKYFKTVVHTYICKIYCNWDMSDYIIISIKFTLFRVNEPCILQASFGLSGITDLGGIFNLKAD